jgi:hypothetical protein
VDQIGGQAIERVIARIYGPDDLIHGQHHFARGLSNRRIGQAEGELANLSETAADLVVQVTGDAGAFSLGGAQHFQSLDLVPVVALHA